MKFESLDELIKRRKGYKYLNKDRTSPYQHHKYVFRKSKMFRCGHLNENPMEDCGAGWNLATLQWILGDSSQLFTDQIIVEFSIPPEAKIIVPQNSIGKFRTDIVRFEKIHDPKNLFPQLKKTLDRCKKYKPINPITATKLPSKKKLKPILTKIKAQVGDQVWDQV